MVREQLSRPFIVLAAVVSVAGAAVLTLTVAAAPPRSSMQLFLLVFAVVLAESFALRLQSFSVSLTYPLVLAAVPIGGPAAAGIVAALSVVNLQDLRERPVLASTFNFGQIVLSGIAAGWTYGWLGGPMLISAVPQPLDATTAPKALVGLLCAALVFNFVNMLLIALAVQLGRGVAFSAVLRDLLSYGPTQLALAFVGLLMAQVLAISWVGFPLFLFPLLLARQVYQRFAGLRDTYLDMVRSLVGALEAKDPYTRGHSERVAAYARELALRVGADERLVETVEQAALLHDIGKLSLPLSVLVKPTGLTDEEYLLVRRHPWTGGEMVQRIPALRRLGDPIKAHHERIDGSGYPVGLLEAEIPLIAKVLAVADAYDAMTTQRAYRSAMSHERAVAELLKFAGSQFDESLVAAFVDAGIGTDVGAADELEPSEVMAS